MTEIDESFFVNLGIEKGVDEIIKRHPRFKGRKKEIAGHIEITRLKERAYDIYKNLANKNISEKKRQEYIVKEISDYVSTGMAFDDEGKEVILMKGLEEKAGSGFIRGYNARKMVRGEQYLDRGLDIAHNLSYLMESGNYAERMPEIAEAASTLENMRLLDPLLKVLRHTGALGKREYNFLQKRVYEKAIKSQEGIMGGIEKYLTSNETKKYEVASVLGLFGLGLLFFNLRFTGAMINASATVGLNIIGMVIILASMVLFLRRKNI